MNLEELKKEYETQDNAYTAYPIYVQVQELVCIGVIDDDYSVNCPYGDGETITEYKYKEDCEPYFKSHDALMEFLRDNKDYKESEFEEFQLGYIWHTIEIFLTAKGADEYIKRDKHNHGKLRKYINHFNSRNFEMRGLLKDIGFKVED